MIPALVIAALTCAALFYVLAPLRRRSPLEEKDGVSPLEDAVTRKRAALGAIVDLEREHELGKLSTEDLQASRGAYEAEAMTALKEVDAFAGSPWEDDSLELEIAAVRDRLRCPTCGGARRPGGTCDKCGA